MLSQLTVTLVTDLNIGQVVCTAGQTPEKLELQRTYAAVYLLTSVYVADSLLPPSWLI